MVEIATPTETGAASLVEMLERLGVELVFGLPGVHNLPIWKALSDSHIRLVGVRHEQTAAYAADGYARATGRLGVALVTTGPGAANTLGGTGEAMAAGSPVLVIATDTSTALRREGVYRGTLHETRDQTAMFVPVTKAALVVKRADEIARATFEAGSTALAPPSGPVYLGIPDRPAVEAGAARAGAGDAPGRGHTAAGRRDRAGGRATRGRGTTPDLDRRRRAARGRGGARGRTCAQAGRAGDHDVHGPRAAGARSPMRGPGAGSRPRGRRAVG